MVTKASLAEELNEMVVWCETAPAQRVNPEILFVLNSQKQDTNYHQNGTKIRKLLQYIRKKEPHLYSLSKRIFVPIYVNFGKTWTYHWVFEERKKTPALLEEFWGSISQPPNSDSFFPSSWQKTFSSWVYKNKNHVISFILWLLKLKAISLICCEFCSYLRIGHSRII